MTKRDSNDVKTWWERDFDEGQYKFRKLNRHAEPPAPWPWPAHAFAPAAEFQVPPNPEVREQYRPGQQAQDVEMADALN